MNRLPSTRADPFVHLHCHSSGSLSDAILTIPEIIAWCDRERVPAHAVTDHGTMNAIYPFLLAARGHNVRALPGCEIYLDIRQIGRAHV